MAEPKTRPTGASVDAFLDGLDDEGQRADSRRVAEIMAGATGCPAAMWGTSLVGFGTYPTGGGTWPVVAFSPRKGKLVLYLSTDLEEHADLLARLGRHTTGRACLYLRSLSDLDEEALGELVALAVAERAGERVD